MLDYAAMLEYPRIDPVIFSIGPLGVRWYGLMYLIGFVAAWLLARHRAQRADAPIGPQQVDDLIFYGALGVMLGGRIGYVFFYGLGEWADDPLYPFKIWEGGMSFHGGLLGVLVAMWLLGRRVGHGFWRMTDFVAPLVPIGLGAGRIGNFINGELWGKPTDLPWGFRVPDDVFQGFRPGPEVLHPSQLYEALLEGLVLFLILWVYSARPRPTMAVSGLFLLFYGIFRTAVEFVRLPDYGEYVAFGWLTRGQVLSLPMIVAGVIVLALAYRGGGREGRAAGGTAGS